MANPSVEIDLLLNGAKAKKALSAFGRTVSGWAKNLSRATMGVNTPLSGLIATFKKLGQLISYVGKALANALYGLGAFAAVGGAAVAGVFLLGNQLAKMGEQADLAGWKTDIIFSDMQEKAFQLAGTIAGELNWSITTVLSSLTRVADIIKPLGVGQEKALRMSAALTRLTSTSPQWSLGAQDPAYGLEAMTKAMVGEKEMLKELGIVIKDTELVDEIEEAGFAVNALNKAIATYNLIGRKAKDMIKASGTRMESYTLAVIEAKEAFKILGETIGRDLMKPFKEFYYLVGSVARAFADMWEGPMFFEWRDSLAALAQNIKTIRQAIEGIKQNSKGIDLAINMGTALASIGKALNKMVTAVVTLFKNVAVPILKFLGLAFGHFLVEGAKSAWAGAKFDAEAAWKDTMGGQFLSAGGTFIQDIADAVKGAADDLKIFVPPVTEDTKVKGLLWKEEDFIRGGDDTGNAKGWSTIGFVDMWDKVLDAGLNAGANTAPEELRDIAKTEAARFAEFVANQEAADKQMREAAMVQTALLKIISTAEKLVSFGI